MRTELAQSLASLSLFVTGQGFDANRCLAVRCLSMATPFQLSLHVRHPSVDPEEISRELSLDAVECFRAGEPRHSRSGLAATAVHGETYWAAVVDPMGWSAPSTVARQRASAVAKDMLSALLPQEGREMAERVRDFLAFLR